MAQTGKQKLTGLGGMNMDTDENSLSPSQFTFIKNHINAVNNLEDGASGGQSTNALTPYPSISTNFDDAYLPHLRTYTIDLSAVLAANSHIISSVKDTTETDSGTAITNAGQLNTYMTSLGFTTTGVGTYEIVDTEFIWQKIIWRKDSDDFYSSTLFVLDPTQGALNGNNTCIGAYYDLKLNQMVWFNYNDANRFNIQIYNATLDTYQTVLETPLLNFDLSYRISSIDLVQAIVQTDGSANTLERLLYWTDKFNAPRKINIDRAIGNEYWNHSNYLNYRTDDEFMCAVKYPPQTRIIGDITSDTTKTVDYIDSSSYQFRQNFVFDDGETSCWSVISGLVMSVTNSGSIINNQYINLRLIDVGSSIVNTINLAYRVGNTGDWRQFFTFNRADYLSNTNIATNINTYTPLTVKYHFQNDNAWDILDQTAVSRLFTKLPQRAGCQEFLDNNIIAYADILTDYDNMSQEDLAALSVDISYVGFGVVPSPTPPYIPYRVLKGGGTYQFGLILYDEANRSTFVQTTDALNKYINTIMENNGYYLQKIDFNFGGITFPDWVKKVAICRTQNTTINRTLEKGFIQWAVNEVTYLDDLGTNVGVGGSPTKVRIKVDGINGFNTDNYNQTTTTYQFAEGDKIMIMSSLLTAWIPPATYGIITKQLRSTDGFELIFDMDSRFVALNTATTPFDVGAIVEIYTPSQVTGKQQFFEISEQLDIDQTTHKYTPDTYSFSPAFGNPTWDTYFLPRTNYPTTSPTTAGNHFTVDYLESHSFSDTVIDSQGEDIGRVNVINENAGQLWYPSLVRYSMPYVQDTFINGLSTFDSGREKTFFRQYGNITRMYCEQFNLCLIQEEKAFRVLVNRNLITSATGDNTVTLTTDILSDALEIQGNFGCQNGETFIGRQGMLYWWDLKRGAFVGGNFERVEDISALYDKDGNAQGIQTYALKQSKAIFNYNNSGIAPTAQIYIHAGFDPKLNQVVFTNWQKDDRANFVNNNPTWTALTNDTVAFRTAGNWQGFFSMTPEMYSMVEGHRLGNAMVSFKEGQPYFHNLNNETTYLNFYGTDCDKYLECVCNEAPDTVKNFMNISVDSKNKSVVLAGTKYEAVSVKTSNNMTSIIPLPSFQQKEGMFWSNFYRNTSLGKTIITGDWLKGGWIKTKLKGDTTKNSEYNEFRGVIVSFTKSEYTN